MKGKKTLILTLSTLLSACVISGCGSKNSRSDVTRGKNSAESSINDSAEKNDGITKIELFQTKREATDTMDKIIDEFEKGNPDIKVEQNTVPDADTVLMARAASDDMPDMFTHYPTDANFVQFVKDGKVKDLTDKSFTSNVIPE